MKIKYKVVLVLMVIVSIILVGCQNEEKAVPENTNENTNENASEKSTEDTSEKSTEESKQEVPEEKKSTDPIDMIVDGRYVYSFFAEGYGDYAYFFHFYEEVPVLGSVFYAGFSNNGSTFSGTYSVEETPFEYELYLTREEAIDPDGITTTGTAPYTITFYDWEGSEIDTCGFDGESIYNDMDVIKASGSGPMIYSHDTDMENTKYMTIYEGEVGVAYLDFIGDEDETSTLTLFHNMTYLDLTGMIVEGAWSMEILDDGSKQYELTPNDESDRAAILTVSGDRVTALYHSDDGTQMSMTNIEAGKAAVVYTFKGEQEITAYNTVGELLLSLYNDGSCDLSLTVFGNSAVIDKGTYAVDENGYTINFVFDEAGESASVLDFDTQEVSLNYIGSVDKIGDINTLLIISPEEETETAELLMSFEGSFTTLDIYTDNTYIFKYADYGLEEIGSWTFDSETYTFTMIQSNGNEIVASIEGDEHVLTLVYEAEANSQLQDTFTSPSSVWGPALAK